MGFNSGFKGLNIYTQVFFLQGKKNDFPLTAQRKNQESIYTVRTH
jgi:hypothetical protein